MQPAMPLPPLRYVVLKFGRHLRDGSVKILLRIEENGLEVWIQADWKIKIDPSDQIYLMDLIEEWIYEPPSQIPALLEELSRQSLGPLTIFEEGQTSAEHFRTMLGGFARMTNSR